MVEAEELLSGLAQVVCDKKGFNLLALDVRGICSMTDYFLIAEGNVDRHVQGMAREIISILKAGSRQPLTVEGLEEGNWVVVDCGDLVIHLFIPDFRQRYRIERVWQEGKIIDLDLDWGEKQSVN